MIDFALNLQRLMARHGLSAEAVVESTGLHPRTVRAILNGNHKPHARTLHQLAKGLGVATDELFEKQSRWAHRQFDRSTNPAVDEVIDSHPEWFEDWTQVDYDELYSRFGTGGALTIEGTAQIVAAMNRNRDVHRKVALLLESGEADLLVGLVDLLYQKIRVSGEL